MVRIRLQASQAQVDLLASGRGPRRPFQVLGPTAAVAFVEELLEQHFGSLTLDPAELMAFLQADPWIAERFACPEWVERDQDQPAQVPGPFAEQALGDKLVIAGALEASQLERLLQDYRPFAAQQRFGEYLRLNQAVAPGLVDLLLNPALFDAGGFNGKRLGERLVQLGLITDQQLEQALGQQQQRGGRLGDVLAAEGWLSPALASFFAGARINPAGEIDYAPLPGTGG